MENFALLLLSISLMYINIVSVLRIRKNLYLSLSAEFFILFMFITMFLLNEFVRNSITQQLIIWGFIVIVVTTAVTGFIYRKALKKHLDYEKHRTHVFTRNVKTKNEYRKKNWIEITSILMIKDQSLFIPTQLPDFEQCWSYYDTMVLGDTLFEQLIIVQFYLPEFIRMIEEFTYSQNEKWIQRNIRRFYKCCINKIIDKDPGNLNHGLQLKIKEVLVEKGLLD